MKNHFRLIGIALFTVSLGVFLANPGTGLTQAAPNPAAAGVLQIAASIKNGNNPAAKNQAAALAAIAGLDDVMHLLKPRKKNGLGVGKIPGAIAPDGIEQMLMSLERNAPGAAALAPLEEMGYQIAAVAEFTAVKPPAIVGKQKAKDWLAWSAEVRDRAADLANAAKAKKPADVKTAAGKIMAACNNCHTVFRE